MPFEYSKDYMTIYSIDYRIYYIFVRLSSGAALIFSFLLSTFSSCAIAAYSRDCYSVWRTMMPSFLFYFHYSLSILSDGAMQQSDGPE